MDNFDDIIDGLKHPNYTSNPYFWNELVEVYDGFSCSKSDNCEMIVPSENVNYCIHQPIQVQCHDCSFKNANQRYNLVSKEIFSLSDFDEEIYTFKRFDQDLGQQSKLFKKTNNNIQHVNSKESFVIENSSNNSLINNNCIKLNNFSTNVSSKSKLLSMISEKSNGSARNSEHLDKEVSRSKNVFDVAKNKKLYTRPIFQHECPTISSLMQAGSLRGITAHYLTVSEK